MPYITLAPEDQTLKIGSYIVLECEATGQPKPKIWWKRDEHPLDSSSRIFFGNENTELHIDHIKESDEGKLIIGGAVSVRNNVFDPYLLSQERMYVSLKTLLEQLKQRQR